MDLHLHAPMDHRRHQRHLDAASGHLHLAAAEYYMERAAGRAPRRHEEPAAALASVDDGAVVADDLAIDVGGIAGGGNGNDDTGEGMEWTMQQVYELLLLLSFYASPGAVYKVLPHHVVQGAAWTWVVILYGLLHAGGVTVFSVRTFGTSTRCLPTFLRVLLLVVTLVSEVSAAICLMPASTLTKAGACFTVLLLLLAHLLIARRR